MELHWQTCLSWMRNRLRPAVSRQSQRLQIRGVHRWWSLLNTFNISPGLSAHSAKRQARYTPLEHRTTGKYSRGTSQFHTCKTIPFYNWHESSPACVSHLTYIHKSSIRSLIYQGLQWDFRLASASSYHDRHHGHIRCRAIVINDHDH